MAPLSRLVRPSREAKVLIKRIHPWRLQSGARVQGVGSSTRNVVPSVSSSTNAAASAGHTVRALVDVAGRRTSVGQHLPPSVLISRPHCRPLHAGRLLRGCGRLPIGGSGMVGVKELAPPAPRVNSLASFWKATRTFPKRRPFATNLLVSTAVYSAADYMVQRMEGGVLDYRRIASFGIFGVVSGSAGWFAYITVFSKLCPNAIRFANHPTLAAKWRDKAGLRDLAKQVALDTLVYTPLVFFPLFYSCMKVIKGGVEVCREPIQSAREALCSYRENFVVDNLTCASVFIWVDVVVFTVPAYMRLPTVQLANFFFMMALSSMRGSENKVGSSVSDLSPLQAVAWVRSKLPSVDIDFDSPIGQSFYMCGTAHK